MPFKGDELSGLLLLLGGMCCCGCGCGCKRSRYHSSVRSAPAAAASGGGGGGNRASFFPRRRFRIRRTEFDFYFPLPVDDLRGGNRVKDSSFGRSFNRDIVGAVGRSVGTSSIEEGRWAHKSNSISRFASIGGLLLLFLFWLLASLALAATLLLLLLLRSSCVCKVGVKCPSCF